jgi:hypothetical protein
MESHERVQASRITRRRFGRMALIAVAAGAAGTGGTSVLAACSSGDDDDSADDDGLASRTDQAEGGGGRGAEAVMYSSPGCGCCGQYADYLGQHGYPVDQRQTDDLDSVRADAGVPGEASGCHTTVLGDYVIEGHVPVEAIDRMVQEQSTVDGIALPGMPNGSPGMSGTKAGPFEIVSFTGGTVRPFMTI